MLTIYNKVREVPKEAQKPIKGGRLKGMTDINPMWRIKKLTETFGMVGIGWYYDIIKQWTEQGSEGQVIACCNIHLFVKVDGEWSKPIPGTGGSKLIDSESRGLYTSDEAFKMALTDAISVSCKAIGIGADIYWQSDRNKYSEKPEEPKATQTELKTLTELLEVKGFKADPIMKAYKIKELSELTKSQYAKTLQQLKAK